MLDLHGNVLLESFGHCRLTIIVVFIDPHHPLQRVHALLQIWLIIEVIRAILWESVFGGFSSGQVNFHLIEFIICRVWDHYLWKKQNPCYICNVLVHGQMNNTHTSALFPPFIVTDTRDPFLASSDSMRYPSKMESNPPTFTSPAYSSSPLEYLMIKHLSKKVNLASLQSINLTFGRVASTLQ